MRIKKAIQIVNYILNKHDGRLNYTKLIKLLYIIERECIIRYEHSMIEDELFCLPKGPILSNTLDLIKNNSGNYAYQESWDRFFERDGWELVKIVENNLSTSNITPNELRLIDEIDSKYYDKDQNFLITLLHDKSFCPEYEECETGRTSLPVSKILENHTSLSPKEIKNWVNEYEFSKKLNSILS